MDYTDESCDDNYDIQFTCTNTTYKDASGKAEGDTVFVITDCASNERLIDKQDPRYDITLAAGWDLHAMQESEATDPYKNLISRSDETCSRGCYCAYNRQNVHNRFNLLTSTMPYEACDKCKSEPCYTCTEKFVGDIIRSQLPLSLRT